MKYYIYLIFVILLISCEDETDVKSDIDRLRMERTHLYKETNKLTTKISSLSDSIKVLSEEANILNIKKTGRKPIFMVKIKLKQSRISLSISEHVKDDMNAIEFELPVDEEFYKSIKVNTQIVDDFRVGSFIMNGSIGSWNMTVIDKYVK